MNVFGDGIKDNHTLYGIHVQGNECSIDSVGFIRVDDIDKILTQDIKELKLY